MGIRLSAGSRGSLGVELGDAALAAKYAREAKEAAETSKAAALFPPKIGENGNWQIWDRESGAYADSGVRAVGPAGAQGPQGEAGNYTKPAAGIPEEDLSQDVRDKLNSGGVSDYAELNNKPAINGVTLSGNKTAAQLDLAAAGDIPSKTSQLQNDAGFLTQHQSLAAYRTAAAQDVIDAGKEAAGLGITGASVGDLVRVNTVDANGRPTSWKKAPLCEIKTDPNLLDNGYFVYGKAINNDYNRINTFPVNQRGQQSYSSANAYCIDRWKLTSGSVSIGQYGITLNGTIVQYLERALGQTVTASALLSDGTMITPTYDDSTKTFTLTASNKTVVAAKLELGSEQTLAHKENGVWVLNEIPDYGEELTKCQRYYVRGVGRSCSGYMGGGPSDVNTARLSIHFYPPMAKAPTLAGINRTSNIIGADDIVYPVSSSVIESAESGYAVIKCTIQRASSSAVICMNTDNLYDFTAEE